MRNETRSHRALAELAGRQHGIVSTPQLFELGYSRAAVSRGVAAGRLHPIHKCAYALGHAALSRQGICFAAILAAGDGALLSHRSAAWLWGLTARWQPVVEVTAASPRHTRSKIRLHSAKALTLDDVSLFDGIPTTAVPRTLLDFAAVDPWYLGPALNNAKRLGLLDLIAIDALVKRSRGFRGVARLREALLLHRPRAFTRSGLEQQFLRLVQSAGLPRPSMNLFIEGYELDAYWEAERFAVELDTYDYHGDPNSFEMDRLRQEDLKLAGIEMTRITGVRMDREPRAIATRLRQLLTQRRQR
jgi:predicted transcriptional regulator of viral defense system